MLDAHQHLIEPSRFRYDWWRGTNGAAEARGLDAFRRETDGAIHETIFIEANVADSDAFAEATWADELCRADAAGVAAVVAAVYPERDDFPRHLAALGWLPAVHGVRRVLHSLTPAEFLDRGFVSNVRKLAEAGFSFDLCVTNAQLAAARELVAACPEVSFVLDHCGDPPIGTAQMSGWADAIKRLAVHKNVYCKFSGLAARVGADRTTAVRTCTPIWSAMIDAFGWERVMWGSDWPLCGSALAWLAVTEELLSPAVPAEQHAFREANARRIYRL